MLDLLLNLSKVFPRYFYFGLSDIEYKVIKEEIVSKEKEVTMIGLIMCMYRFREIN